ncbi:MFS transporter [Streptomyces chartreusis]|uniref:MFS transporter n=1 Tax=Streptomyces chartreusis TaxID=1969 RepID=UPI0036389216
MTAQNVLVPRFGLRPIVPLGMGLAAAAMAWLTTLDLTSTYAAHVMPPLLVSGVGLGLVMAPAIAVATAGVRSAEAGVASAMVNTSQQIGGSIGTSVLNTLATSATTTYLHGKPPSQATLAQAQLHGYDTAYWWSAAFFAAGLLITVTLYRSGPLSAQAAAARAVPTGQEASGSAPAEPGR